MSETLDAALAYAKHGWYVFPCQLKVPLTPHGFKDASTDPAIIATWWQKFPDAGVAIRTGNGLGVLDVDPRNGGEDGLETLLSGHLLPDVPLALTGGGGAHRYFAIPLNTPCRTAIAPGVDWKADGGYVVAPPSPHASGHAYAWEASSSPFNLPLAQIPDWLLKVVAGVNAGTPCPTPEKPLALAPPLPATIREGARRTWLLSFAGTLRRRGASIQTILASLHIENRQRMQPPLNEIEIADLAGDAVRRWKEVQELKKEKTACNTHRDGLTDLGNAERFADRFGSELRYCYAWGKWIVWMQTHWKKDAQGEAERAAQLIPIEIAREAAEVLAEAKTAAKEERHEDAEHLKLRATALKRWAQKSESTGRIAGMLHEARAKLEARSDVFDFNVNTLNCGNGTVDTRTGIMHPHNRSDYITKIVPTDFSLDADTSFISEFALQVMNRKQHMADFLRRAFGSSVSGNCPDQVMFFLHGIGQNGKSKLVEAVTELLADYAMAAPADFLVEKHYEQHPTALADLQGRRFVSTIEVGAGKHMAEALLKQITGGDKIRARKMREDFSEFRPVHKLFLAANHRPIVRENDYALFRRILMIAFPVHFWNPEKGESGPPHLQMDPLIPEKLRANFPGLLAWLVQGCIEWHHNGLKPPPEVLAETLEYREEMDHVANWKQEQTVFHQDWKTPFSTLFNSFLNWSKHNGTPRLSRIAFSAQLVKLGCEKTRDSLGSKGFSDIRLVESTTCVDPEA